MNRRAFLREIFPCAAAGVLVGIGIESGVNGSPGWAKRTVPNLSDDEARALESAPPRRAAVTGALAGVAAAFVFFPQPSQNFK